MRITLFFAVAAASLLNGCTADRKEVFDQFVEVPKGIWSWHAPTSFTFTIEEKDYLYDIHCGLRITGDYKYSNIWLIYELQGPDVNKKVKFQIPLADDTGKWLGKGSNNLISFSAPVIKNIPLKPGKYTIKLYQNMWDEELEAVSDIGIRVSKVTKVY